MTGIDAPALAARLAAVIAPDRIEQFPGVDILGVAPELRAVPETVEELAACLRIASESGAACVPWGGGTQQHIGLPPRRAGLLLDTGRLDSLVEWEPADLTGCFGAGMTLATAQSRLADAAQHLGVDAPLAERATLGGLAATNTIGPRRWLYGGWRDQVIGMQMVLADGEVIKSGGRVVKNVQGYDLAKLFIGSLGTLGVIVQINLKSFPIAAGRRLFVGRGERDAVAAFLEEVADSQLRVSTVDLLDGASAEFCGLGGAGSSGLVLVEGTARVIAATMDRLRRLAAGHGLSAEDLSPPALDSVWEAWLALGRIDDLNAHEAVLAVGCRPSEVLSATQCIADAVSAVAVSARCWARAGNGAVYARLSASGPDAHVPTARVQRELLARWPRTTLTSGSPALADATRPWGAETGGMVLMRAIKERFDPTRTLQPGRFAGGI